jgi:hypothetical protein
MPGLHFELRQDGIAKGFGGDAGAIGDEENSAVGHEISSSKAVATPWLPPTIAPIIQISPCRSPT